MASGDTGWARVPAILSFPDTSAFAETYGFSAASGTVWLEGQYLIPGGGAPVSSPVLFSARGRAARHCSKCRERFDSGKRRVTGDLKFFRPRADAGSERAGTTTARKRV